MGSKTPEEIAAGLSCVQREAVKSFALEPRQMGLGMMEFLSGLVEPCGINHPLFGPHYRLTGTGLAVRAILQSQEPQP